MSRLSSLLAEVRACGLCASQLPLGPRPVLQLQSSARLLIAAQAPGKRVHETGIPFSDASGDRLRDWLGLPPEQFYDAHRVAILPMGFCYPGRGRSGDLPPRAECARTWRAPLLGHLRHLRLTLVIGQYALAHHLPELRGALTQAVQAQDASAAAVIALPHPSPRNNGWLKHHPWFERELLPLLRRRVAAALAD
jgi:uracil-DNA glycosylase